MSAKFYYCDGVGCGNVQHSDGLPIGWIKKYDSKTGEDLFFCSQSCFESNELLNEKSKAWLEKVEE